MAKDRSKPDDNNKDGKGKPIDWLAEGFNRLLKPALKPLQPTDFFRAVKSDRADELQKLLEAGADPNAYNLIGQAPLHVAAINNAVKAAETLIEHGADPLLGQKGQPRQTPLEDAVTSDQPEMVAFLAEHGGYVPGILIDGWSVLHRACKDGQTRSVEALLRAGGDCSEKTDSGAPPLLIAAASRHEKLVRALLEFPAAVATMNDCFVNNDPKKRTAFQFMVESQNVPLVELMIAKGGEINSHDGEGRSPLLSAIEDENLDLMRLLIEHGADLNAPCGPEGTPLVYASKMTDISDERTRAEMIDLLIGAGADADIPSPEGILPVRHLLSLEKPLEGLTALLRYPVDLNARPAKGALPPLTEAVQHGNLDCVQVLLKAGADPKLLDSSEKPALFYAREAGQKDIIAALEQVLKKKPAPKPPAQPSP